MELSRQQGALPSASRSKWKLSYALGSFEAPFVEERSSLFYASDVVYVRVVWVRPSNHQQLEVLQIQILGTYAM